MPRRPRRTPSRPPIDTDAIRQRLHQALDRELADALPSTGGGIGTPGFSQPGPLSRTSEVPGGTAPRSYSSDIARPGGRKIKGRPIEIGLTGTVVSGGLILSDPNSELQFPRSIAIYDKMRRTDGQVKASLLALTLPILSLDWDIEPFKEQSEEGGNLTEPTPQDQEIAEFVKKDLLEGMTTSWKHILRQVLGMMWAGFWIVEPVYEVRDDGKVHLRKLGSRLPSSVFRWKIARDGGLIGIIQRAVNPETGMTELIEINAEDLVVFTHEKEGADWSGISVLRSAYKHWYMKDWLYRLGVINVERGGGFPVIKLPEEAVDNDLRAAHDVGESIHMHDRAYVIEPPGWEFRLETGTSRIGDVMTQVQHHDQKISANILAQFLDLGSTESGSRALGGEFIEIFLMAEEAVIFNIEDTVNHYLIKRWVDYNWKDVKGYPKLKAQNIRGFNPRRSAPLLRMLADGKIIIPDEPLETFIRKSMGLPEADPNTRREQQPMLPGGDPGAGGPFREVGGVRVPSPSPGGQGKTPSSPAIPGMERGVSAAPPSATPSVTGGSGADASLTEGAHVLGNLQVPVPAAVADAVRVYQEALAPAALTAKGVETDPHVTIKYGLTTIDPAAVMAALQGVRKIRMALGVTKVFSQPDQDVLVVGVDSPDIVGVRNQVEKALGWEDTHAMDSYQPHLTLAYLKSGEGAKYVNDPTFKGQKWIADEVVFSPKGEVSDTTITLSRPHWLMLAESRIDLVSRPFFYRRPLTALERNVNFAEIDAKQKLATKDILAKIEPIQRQQADALAKLVTGQGEGRFDGIAQIKVPFTGRMAGVIKSVLKDVFDYGRQQVRAELQRQSDVKGGTSAVKLAEQFALVETQEMAFDYLGAKADVLAERYANRLKDAAVTAKLKAARTGKDEEQERSLVRDALLALTGAAALGIIFQSVAESFAIGRRVEINRLRVTGFPPPPVPDLSAEGFPSVPDSGGGGEEAPPVLQLPSGGIIGRAQYSAVMDENTCSPCEAMDGRIGAPEEFTVPNPDCIGERYGNTCRCVLIYELA